jgi:glycosyltransferase involved in cell wall biosynthesis
MTEEKAIRVLALEGYYGASHRAFLDGLAAHSSCAWDLLTLPDKAWKRRMRSGVEELLAANSLSRFAQADLILVTDMLDASRLRRELKSEISLPPIIVYFHENQLTYPVRHSSDDYWQYGLINIQSVLAAERVLFNSRFHRDDFLGGMPDFFAALPEEALDSLPGMLKGRAPAETISARIAAASDILYPGIDIAEIDREESPPPRGNDSLVILWNHRWEHDKRPEVFFAALRKLLESGVDFRVIICGESFNRKPQDFLKAEKLLGQHLLHFGYAHNRREYLGLLHRCDIVVSSAAHEFFGIAVMEACAAGCRPLLPRRLSYPELIPDQLHHECLYDDDADFTARLLKFARHPLSARQGTWPPIARQFNWPKQAAIFDRMAEDLLEKRT